jgi:hypothetical protein
MFGFSLISLYMDATLGTTIHVPGKSNVVCDHLSRGVSAEQLGLDPATAVDTSTSSVAVNSFLLITNPLIVYDAQAEQERGLRGLIAFLAQLFHRPLQKSTKP